MAIANPSVVCKVRRAIAMTLVHLFLCLSETGVRCDHTVHLARIKFMVG